MVKRPTIADLARASGVSVATVDRVLNGRLPVRRSTARLVADAAKRIGFHAAELIDRQANSSRREYRLGFLLQKPEQAFYRQFADALEAAARSAADFSAVPVIDFSSSPQTDGLVGELNRLAAKVDAVALVTPDSSALGPAVEALRARGKPVFSLLSDFAIGARTGYVGVDNRKVGRTAAWMIATCAKRPGKVALFVGSHGFHGHEMREIGLRSYFREHAPAFTVLETFVNHETVELTHETMRDLLAREPDLVGCYVAGGGSEGAIAALRDAGLAPPPVLVCNEDTPATRRALAEGIVALAIVTPVERLGRELVALMGAALSGSTPAAGRQAILQFDLLLPESF